MTVLLEHKCQMYFRVKHTCSIEQQEASLKETWWKGAHYVPIICRCPFKVNKSMFCVFESLRQAWPPLTNNMSSSGFCVIFRGRTTAARIQAASFHSCILLPIIRLIRDAWRWNGYSVEPFIRNKSFAPWNSLNQLFSWLLCCRSFFFNVKDVQSQMKSYHYRWPTQHGCFGGFFCIHTKWGTPVQPLMW